MDAAFNSAKRACYSGFDSVTLRREVADRVSTVVAFDAYAFSTCDPDTGLMAHTVAAGVPPALARMYVKNLYPQGLASLGMDMPRKGINVYSNADHSPDTRAVLHEYGLNQQLHVAIAIGGRLWGTWCLMRASASSAAARREYAFLKRLEPHLARGLQTAALVDRGLAADEGALSESAPGVLVLDSRNRQTLRTRTAATWLEDLRDVGIQMPEAIPLSIVGLAHRVRSKADAATCGEVHMRARGLSGRWYTLRASLSEPDASGDSSLVVVIRPSIPVEVAAILSQLYGFSAREREVVAAVTRGDATKTIAADLGVSPHTVTEHIDRACYKLGVRGRKALIAKLFFDGYAPTLNSAKPTITQATA
ncbi:MAG TPA: helix-turn-helix transcriptional regulator [Gemmatimonadaceae bacterium]|nr:helix-turn-helix transcriptional regulator [Gemmatimonadaceae bacterium]